MSANLFPSACVGPNCEEKANIPVPKISVIIPVYNAQEYLVEALSSVVEQTFSEIEIVCVNDGSTDDSLRILQEFAQKDPRIHIYTKENEGFLGHTLNYALARVDSRVRYVARMDADDICCPDRLQRQWEFMEANQDVDISGAYMYVFEEANPHKPQTINKVPGQPTLRDILDERNLFHPTVVFRKSFLDKYGIRYARGTKLNDKELWMRCAVMHSAVIANIKAPLLRYRMLPDSLSHSIEGRKIRDREKQQYRAHYCMFLKKNDQRRYKQLRRKLLELRLKNLHLLLKVFFYRSMVAMGINTKRNEYKAGKAQVNLALCCEDIKAWSGVGPGEL